MAARPKKVLALETNLLLDLGGGKDFAHDFKEEFLSRGYDFVVPPTVVAELAFFAALKNAAQGQMANVALEKLASWKCQPLTLSSTDLAIAFRFAIRLIESGLIPETEPNDGKILAQTSLGKIPLLVSSDKHLLEIDEDALLLTFNEADLFPVRASHPKRLLKALR